MKIYRTIRLCAALLIFQISVIYLSPQAIALECKSDLSNDLRECLDTDLRRLDDEIEKRVSALIQETHSEWGGDADAEIKERMLKTQLSWKSYRDGFCAPKYYTKASTHPPSQDEIIIRCKITKAKERLAELQN